MSDKTIMEFHVCTARVGKRGNYIGGAKITTDGLDTISILFLQ